ncbi:MAG: hypothetical protein NZ958_04965 [Bacteroidia bacterium]|nr:hypothetical protein [Bacteroidia bacterium]MDW8089392.1 hypothetical protein [Bacteroidia bacterium]
MGSRILLGGLSLICGMAQKPFRPFNLGLGSVFLFGPWQGTNAPFPQKGYLSGGVGLSIAKEYYTARGNLGVFVFFEGFQLDLASQKLIESLLPEGQRLAEGYQIPKRTSFLNSGGGGFLLRQRLGAQWAITLATDLRIVYLSYPDYDVPLQNGNTFTLILDSNSFIGMGLRGTLWHHLDPKSANWLGLSLSTAWVAGLPAKYEGILYSPAGKEILFQHQYYFQPQYLALFLHFTFKL